MEYEGLPVNPEDLPDDISAIAEMLGMDVKNEEDDDGVSLNAKDEKEAEVKTAPEDAESKLEPKVDTPAEPEPKMVPLGALQAEREKARIAKENAAELERQLAELKGKPVDAKTDPDTSELSDEELEKLDDIPEVKAIVQKLAGQNKKLQAQLDEAISTTRTVVEHHAATVKTTVQKHIDAIPELSYWQNENPEMWSRAVQMDNALRQDPETRNLSTEARFERVVNAMTAIYGPVELPETYRPTTPKGETPKTPTGGKGVKEKAEAVVEEVKRGNPKVNTLSDIPGGTPPASDIDNLENLSGVEIGNMLINMPIEKVDELLSRLG